MPATSEFCNCSVVACLLQLINSGAPVIPHNIDNYKPYDSKITNLIIFLNCFFSEVTIYGSWKLECFTISLGNNNHVNTVI